MEIYIKLGTGPAKMMKLCRKRKQPELGDIIKVKEIGQKYAPEQGGLVDGIKTVHEQTLYLAERF